VVRPTGRCPAAAWEAFRPLPEMSAQLARATPSDNVGVVERRYTSLPVRVSGSMRLNGTYGWMSRVSAPE
jgi:hypothetical protein